MTAFVSVSQGKTPCAGVSRYVSGRRKSPSRGGNIQRYLEDGGRALAMDFAGIEERQHGNWAEVFDETRESTLVNRSVRNERTWYHYVISPDKRDACSLAMLRSLATDFCERFFGGCQVAIAYHDDNATGILHAHLIVNNVVIEGEREGLRLHIDKATSRAMEQWVQSESRKRGLSWFKHYEGEEDAESQGQLMFRAEMEHSQWRRKKLLESEWWWGSSERREWREANPEPQAPKRLACGVNVDGARLKERIAAGKTSGKFRSLDPERLTPTEKRLRAEGSRGSGWKDAIRDAVHMASTLCDGTRESWKAELGKLGVEVVQAGGDWTYTINASASPDGREHGVRSYRLGADYGRQGVASMIYRNGLYERACAAQAGRVAAILNGQVRVAYDGTGISNAELDEIRRGCGLSMTELFDVLTVIGSEHVRSVSAMRARADRLEAGEIALKAGEDERAERASDLRAAADVAERLGLLPDKQSASKPAPRAHMNDAKESRKTVSLDVKVAKGMRLTKREYDYVMADKWMSQRWRAARRAERHAAEEKKQQNGSATRNSSSNSRSSRSRSAPARSKPAPSRSKTR